MSSNTTKEKSSRNSDSVDCPVCNKMFERRVIEEHVNKCLFLNTNNENNLKRTNLHSTPPPDKRLKIANNLTQQKELEPSESVTMNTNNYNKGPPLAESLRPIKLTDIIGHKEIFGSGSMLHSLLEQKKVTNMILWGPPGCGKVNFVMI